MCEPLIFFAMNVSILCHLCDIVDFGLVIYRPHGVVYVFSSQELQLCRYIHCLTCFSGVSLREIFWEFLLHSWIHAGGSSVNAIIICLDRCSKMVGNLLTVMWNTWLAKACATSCAARVGCHLVGNCSDTNVSKLGAVFVTMIASAEWGDIITFQAIRTRHAVLVWVVNGGLLRPVKVCTSLDAPTLDVPFCG